MVSLFGRGFDSLQVHTKRNAAEKSAAFLFLSFPHFTMKQNLFYLTIYIFIKDLNSHDYRKSIMKNNQNNKFIFS